MSVAVKHHFSPVYKCTGPVAGRVLEGIEERKGRTGRPD
jgi:hypothetical protein